MTTTEAFLNAGGAPSAKFPTVGTTVKGIVVDASVQQQRDIQTGEPKVWPDGGPMMQLVVTLATDERDAEVDDDDGHRRVFIKGQMLSALKSAIKQAGVKDIESGGTLAIQYKGDGEQKRAGFNAPKLYVAQYKAPASSPVSVDELL